MAIDGTDDDVVGGPDITETDTPGESGDATAPQLGQNESLSEARRPQF